LCLPFCKTVAEKTEHLPRQARDRHRESWKRDVMFLQAAICGGRQRLGAAATRRNVSLAATRVARQSPTAASARRASRGRSRRRQSRAFSDTRMLCTRSSHSGEERTHSKPKQGKALVFQALVFQAPVYVQWMLAEGACNIDMTARSAHS
jgi:hypothetical protein